MSMSALHPQGAISMRHAPTRREHSPAPATQASSEMASRVSRPVPAFSATPDASIPRTTSITAAPAASSVESDRLAWLASASAAASCASPQPGRDPVTSTSGSLHQTASASAGRTNAPMEASKTATTLVAPAPRTSIGKLPPYPAVTTSVSPRTTSSQTQRPLSPFASLWRGRQQRTRSSSASTRTVVPSVELTAARQNIRPTWDRCRWSNAQDSRSSRSSRWPSSAPRSPERSVRPPGSAVPPGLDGACLRSPPSRQRRSSH